MMRFFRAPTRRRKPGLVPSLARRGESGGIMYTPWVISRENGTGKKGKRGDGLFPGRKGYRRQPISPAREQYSVSDKDRVLTRDLKADGETPGSIESRFPNIEAERREMGSHLLTDLHVTISAFRRQHPLAVMSSRHDGLSCRLLIGRCARRTGPWASIGLNAST